jgi:hypothetical protein
MKKRVVGVLLICAAGSVMANWVRVRGDGVVTVLADPATIVRSGDVVKMWSVINYAQPRTTSDGKTYSSSRQQLEYDCTENQSRSLFFSRHTEYTGWGDVVYRNDTPGRWIPVPPGSIGGALMKFACHLP